MHLIRKVRPGVDVADGIAGIDFEDGLERGVVDAEPHGLIIALNHVDAALLLFFRHRAGRVAH